MTNVALTCCVVITSVAFLSVFPLKEVRFAFLREETNKVWRVEPVSRNVDGYEVLLEAKAREFVADILPIDVLTQAGRYGRAFKMATAQFYETFKRDRLDSGFMTEARKSRLNRSIRIEAVDVRQNPANPETHLVSADVVQLDRFGNAEEAKEKRLRVFLEMTALPQIVSESELYTNPLGILVLNMTIKERS